MIQTLQKKVVVTAMAAVTVLLLFLLGAINVANMLIVERQVDRTLRIISDSEAGGIPPRSDGAPPFMEAPKNDYDTVLSSNFFVVRFDWVGNILNADIQRTSSVTEEEAREMAAQAYDSGQDSGRTGKFRYLFHKTPVGSVVVFLDTSGERLSLVRILLLSVALGAACWGIFLLHEPVGGQELAGMGLLFGGVALLALGKKTEGTEPTEEREHSRPLTGKGAPQH